MPRTTPGQRVALSPEGPDTSLLNYTKQQLCLLWILGAKTFMMKYLEPLHCPPLPVGI